MSFSIGIVGLPNVGKSTLFKALTKREVSVSSYPFCTIDPNVGIVTVPDERLEKLNQVLKPKKVIPTVIEFVDIAGLVKDAHKGEGLGNQFLAYIRETAAIIHLIRSFKAENIAHVEGKIDPKRDIETVNLELVMADLKTVEKRIEGVQGKARSGEKEAQKILKVLEKILKVLDQGKFAREAELSKEEKELTGDLNLLTLKPTLYVMNVGEEELTTNNLQLTTYKNQLPVTIRPRAHGREASYQLSICAKLESEFKDLSNKEAKEYLKELGLKEQGLERFIKASYKLLDLITFYTSQNEILQAWTLKRDSNILEAAAKVHTDFAEKFIKAEVINWQDLLKSSSEIKAREWGLVRTEGKDYIVQDGDVVKFKI